VSTAHSTADLATALVFECRGLDAEPLKSRPDGADRAHLLVGRREARVRGKLDSLGYEVRESDVPVRDGYEALLEVSRDG
jgi:hypothetical protein